MLSVQSWSKVGLALRTTKESKIKSTSTRHRFKIRSCGAEFQRRLWAFAPQPGNSVSDHAEELSGFLLKHARDVFW